MEATLTNISYRYRAPQSYLWCGVLFLLIAGTAAFFFAVIAPWIFRAICIFIMAVGVIGGLPFIAIYLRSLHSRVIISQDSIVLPCRRKMRNVVIPYSEMSFTEERYGSGRQIKISGRDGRTYLLDDNWMPKGAFDEMLGMLNEKTGA